MYFLVIIFILVGFKSFVFIFFMVVVMNFIFIFIVLGFIDWVG